MFVLLTSFIFVLILSVGRTTDNKTLQLKDKLTHSLTHIKDTLVNIEGKIEHERKTLSQINYDLNRKHNFEAGGNNYDDVTDIWWKSENPEAPVDHIPKTTKPTKTQTPFIQDLKKTMKEDNHNYLTAFLTKFLQLIATKNVLDTMPVLYLLKSEAQKELDKGSFNYMGKQIVAEYNETLYMFNEYILPTLKERALMLYREIKNKHIVHNQMFQMIDFYGNRFTGPDGEKLFEALESFNDYPNGKKTAAEVSDLMSKAVLTPHLRPSFILGNKLLTTTISDNDVKRVEGVTHHPPGPRNYTHVIS